jgi:hypothetical protein
MEGPASLSPILRLKQRPPGQLRSGPTSTPHEVVNRPIVEPPASMRFSLGGKGSKMQSGLSYLVAHSKDLL